MRQEIAHQIEETPGIHLRALQRELDCSSTTLNYHIRDLNIKERKIRGYRRLYPEKTPKELERSLAALNHDVRGPMMYYIDSGSSPSDLVDKLDVSKSTVSSHLRVLEEDGLVEEEKEGRRKKLTVSGNARKAVNRYASKILDEASEGFIEMWE